MNAPPRTDNRFNVGRWPSMHVIWRPEQVALIDGDRKLTYRALDASVGRLGQALIERGIGFGDRVALLCGNRIETIQIVLACARIGAIAVPLNFRLVARELAFMLQDSGARILFVDPTFGALATDAVAALDAASPTLQTVELGVPFDALFSGASGSVDAVPVDEQTPHLIMYTAGTTGLPKGVTLTHGNTFWQTVNALNLGLGPGVVGLSILPLFHVGGLNGSVMPLIFIGGTVVLQRAFDPTETLRLIEKHRVQGMVGVPAVFQMMAAMPQFQTADLSSVVAFTSGGAPLPLHVIDTYKARGVVFRQGYGLTECAPGVTGMEPQDAYAKPGSVGRACHHTHVRVVDEAGNDCPASVEGEVIVAGPNVMIGYWNREKDTAEAIQNGWLHTGDAGHFDADGYLYVAGRIKEMIISGGENIYPAEVANALFEHPALVDCAVIGVPDEKWGQRPVAFVVLHPAAGPAESFDTSAFNGFLQDRLAKYKHPREYRFVKFLPRNATGKVVKGELLKLM